MFVFQLRRLGGWRIDAYAIWLFSTNSLFFSRDAVWAADDVCMPGRYYAICLFSANTFFCYAVRLMTYRYYSIPCDFFSNVFCFVMWFEARDV